MAVRVLIFGEGKDPYDSQAIEYLLRAIYLEGQVQLKPKKLRNPIILSRNAERSKRTAAAEQIAGHDDAERAVAKAGDVVVSVGFHDCDALEPAHIAAAEQLEQEMRDAGVERPVAAVPAWCIEAWWMLFPEALHKTRRCWRHLPIPNNVGSIREAKNELRRKLRPGGSARCTDYEECDSPTIARHVLELQLVSEERIARSASLTRFRNRFSEAIQDND